MTDKTAYAAPESVAVTNYSCVPGSFAVFSMFKWLRETENYNDAQYGKRSIREALDISGSELHVWLRRQRTKETMMVCDDFQSIVPVFESEAWELPKCDRVTIILCSSGAGKNVGDLDHTGVTYGIHTRGGKKQATADFPRPMSGLLVSWSENRPNTQE